MDHFLDYVFVCSVLVGYALILPDKSSFHLLLILAVFGGFLAHSFLAFAATETFQISYLKFGPTEFRIALVVINTLLIFFGKHHMTGVLPFMAFFSSLGLSILIYRTQSKIWKIDMENKGALK